MADQPESASFLRSRQFRLIVGIVVIIIVAVGVWVWATAGRESTDDAQVDGHVTQIAPRVGGTVQQVPVNDNQPVEAGAVLVRLDPRDSEVAVEKARAELADAEASAHAVRTNVPIAETTATSNVTVARGSVQQAASGVAAAQKDVDVARARLATAQAHLREVEAMAAKALRDVERLRGLLAKDEVSQQQFDAATAAATAQRAATDSARAQVAEAEAGIPAANSRLAQAKVAEQQAGAALRTALSGRQQVQEIQARAEAAEAHVRQAKATLAQAELNLLYTVVKAPVKGTVSRKTVEVGQVVQPSQPTMALIPLDTVWVTANFKETQLTNMRPGQPATVKVDAYDVEFKGHVESIAAATGAKFSLLPPENATGNYVKVVQRVPVKIVLELGQDPQHLLRPGMSVVPTVYTR